MTTTMDIVVAYDSSLLITMHKDNILRTVESVTYDVSPSDQNDIRYSLVEFQSHIMNFLTQTHPFTASKEQFHQWVDDVPTESITEKSCKTIANALAECLTLDWRSNMFEHAATQKLVILFTAGPPCNLLNDDCCTNGLDLWKIAGEFKKKNIILAVVDLETSTIYEDFYCALARKTGGEYLPMVNAASVLSKVVQRTINEPYGLSQSFREVDMRDIERGSKYKFKYIENRVRYMLNNCHTMDDIREEYMFAHRTSEIFDFGLSTETNSFMSPSDEYDTSMSSTSTADYDDEGYPAELPTTASMDSSMESMINSPASYDDTDFLILKWSS